MATEYDKYLLPAVLLLAVIGVIYSGFAGISGEVVSIATKQCVDSDRGIDIFSPGTCGDDYNIMHDYCNLDGSGVIEYHCSGTNICEETFERCGEGWKCKAGEGYCISA